MNERPTGFRDISDKRLSLSGIGKNVTKKQFTQ